MFERNHYPWRRPAPRPHATNLALAVVAVLIATLPPALTAQNPPNVLLILLDDVPTY